MMGQALQFCAEQKKYELGVEIFNQLADEVRELSKQYNAYMAKIGSIVGVTRG